MTGLSLPIDDDFAVPTRAVQAVFWGLGADGTVGANKASIKIIGEHTDQWAQGYFVYDSRKSGAVTTSHLRFGPDPIRSTYLIDAADFVACHQWSFLDRPVDLLGNARPGATFLLDSPYAADEVWGHLPIEIQQTIIDKSLDLWVINAGRVARDAGMGNRINTVMQPCFFALSGVLPRAEAIAAIKANIEHAYGKRGQVIVDQNHAAVDASLAALQHVDVPASTTGHTHRRPPVPDDAPDFVQRITARMLAGEGDLLPVSAPAGRRNLPDRDCAVGATDDRHRAARLGPRHLHRLRQVHDLVPPHRHPDEGLRARRPQRRTGDVPVEVVPLARPARPSAHHPGGARRLHGLRGLRRRVPGALEGAGQPQGARHGTGGSPAPGHAADLRLLQGDPVPRSRRTGPRHDQGQPSARTALRVLGRMRRLRRDAVPPPAHPAVRRSHGGGERNRVFVDLRRQSPDDTVEHERRRSRTGVVELALRGQRRVRPRSTPGQRDPRDRGAPSAQRAHRPGRVPISPTRSSMPSSGPTPTSAPNANGCRADPPRALHDASDWRERRLYELADELVRTSTWIVGGDGWAYDIGYSGLDHVLATGRDVNVLVLDTEVYSNTGGQASKATARGAVAKFAAAGKPIPKKDLGATGRQYGNVFVGQVAIGASEQQTVRTLLEADAWPGPSLVIAYSTCIAHGIDMSKSISHMKEAVQSGYWPLYRFHPGQRRQGASSLRARQPCAEDPAATVHRERSPVRDAAPRRSRTGRDARRVWRRPTSTSDGATTSSWPTSSAAFQTCPRSPPRCLTSRPTYLGLAVAVADRRVGRSDHPVHRRHRRTRGPRRGRRGAAVAVRGADRRRGAPHRRNARDRRRRCSARRSTTSLRSPTTTSGPTATCPGSSRRRPGSSVPVIASLNATSAGGWVRYAKLLEDAGADALELNIYEVHGDPTRTAAEVVEDDDITLAESVQSMVEHPGRGEALALLLGVRVVRRPPRRHGCGRPRALQSLLPTRSRPRDARRGAQRRAVVAVGAQAPAAVDRHVARAPRTARSQRHPASTTDSTSPRRSWSAPTSP